MSYRHDDGGRAAYFRGSAGDCVTRAIAIAAELDYRAVYDELHVRAKDLGLKKPSPRSGTNPKAYLPYLEALGFRWVPLVKVGMTGPKPRYTDAPQQGRIILRMGKHLSALIDGAIHDTWDSRHRAVYGYWTR